MIADCAQISFEENTQIGDRRVRLCDQSSPQFGPLASKHVDRIGEHVREEEGIKWIVVWVASSPVVH